VARERIDLLAALGPFTRALRRVEDDAAAAAGITMWQYAILAVVTEDPNLNQGEVATRLGYSKNRIVADLDLLEQRKLLTRVPGPDRRANLLHATAAGRRLMQQVRSAIRRGEDHLLKALPDDQRRNLTSAMQTITEALDRPTSRSARARKQ
jgi:DNA-binding MarR family transcriptional regulator